MTANRIVAAQRRLVVSVVTPAFNEANNLHLLHAGLKRAMDEHGLKWEWIVVDDHSQDETFAVLRELARSEGRLRAYRFARNSGSHVAVRCGLDRARGDCAVVMAADLQDPPDTIPLLVEKWKAGADVVWAIREERLGESKQTLLFARLYYWLMRKVVGLQSIPEQGADFFLVDRKVIDAVSRFYESNTSILALLSWMGFKQESISYVKQARTQGRSGWTMGKR
jgi:dolichol-phosphate mannosyltransferase